MWREWHVSTAFRRIRLVPWQAVGPTARALPEGAWELVGKIDRPTLIDICQELGILPGGAARASTPALQDAVLRAVDQGALVAIDVPVAGAASPPPRKKPAPPPKPEEPTPVNPLLEPAKLVAVVKKVGKNPATGAQEPYTSPRRQALTLQTDAAFDGTATFTWDKPDKVRFYSAESGGTEIKVDGSSNVFKPRAPPAWAGAANLASGVTVYAEAAAASAGMDDITAKLSLSGGSRPTGPARTSTITSVEVTLDLCQSRIDGADPAPLAPGDRAFRSRFLCVRHPKREIERAKLVVRQARPAAFGGKLELSVSGAVKLYATEKRTSGDPAQETPETPTPIVLDNASLGTPKEYWVEGTAASAAIGDVVLKLGLQGVEPEGDLAKITNVSAAFARSENQKWGYDDLDDPDAEYHHLSVKKSDDTVALCQIGGPITGAGAPGGVIFLACDDAGIADVTAPAELQPSFDLTVNGKDKTKAATLLRARINDAKGPVCASLMVHVYALKELEVTILKAEDGSSAGTALTRADFDVAAAETAINEWYKPAVVRVTLTDHADDGQAVDIAYDLNGNGTLDLEPGGITSPEEQAIKSEFNPAGQKVVIVKDLSWIYYLRAAAAIGDTKIKVKTAYADYMKFIGVGETYRLGAGPNRESIRVKAKTGTEIELHAALTKTHPTTDGLLWPLSGLSGNPIWVAEQSKTEDKERQTIGHELGHSLFQWLDVDASESLMHYSSGRADTRLRCKELTKKYDPGTEIQWDKVSR